MLKFFGNMHLVHHLAFDERLNWNKNFERGNIFFHHVPEYIVHMFTCVSFVLFGEFQSVIIAMFVMSGVFIRKMIKGGKDDAHCDMDRIKRPQKFILVDKHYHAYHHVNINSHYSSLTKLFDVFLGTSISLKGKMIALSGSQGALGKEFSKLLSKENVKGIVTLKYGVDYSENNFGNLDELLKNVDILIVLHGSLNTPYFSHVESFKKMIEVFLKVNPIKKVPLEIWAVGSESELHPVFNKRQKAYAKSKRIFAKYAKYLYSSQNIIYRHIVPSSFSSGMNVHGIMTPGFTARYALFLIKRGFRYVPVTFTGVALLNYIYFKIFLRPKKLKMASHSEPEIPERKVKVL